MIKIFLFLTSLLLLSVSGLQAKMKFTSYVDSSMGERIEDDVVRFTGKDYDHDLRGGTVVFADDAMQVNGASGRQAGAELSDNFVSDNFPPVVNMDFTANFTTSDGITDSIGISIEPNNRTFTIDSDINVNIDPNLHFIGNPNPKGSFELE